MIPMMTKTYQPTRHKLGIVPQLGHKTAFRLMDDWHSEHNTSVFESSTVGAGSGSDITAIMLPCLEVKRKNASRLGLAVRIVFRVDWVNPRSPQAR